MTRAAIIVDHGFQDEEYVYSYYRMLEEGWQVSVASPDGGERRGKFGVPARCSRMIGNLYAKDYDAVVIPGGFESPDRLRTNEYAVNFVREMHEAGKLIAAICHGPWLLISARIVKGKNVCGYHSLKDDLINAGAIYSYASVLVDGNIITADHYRNNGPFMKTVVRHGSLTAWGPELCGAAAVNL